MSGDLVTSGNLRFDMLAVSEAAVEVTRVTGLLEHREIYKGLLERRLQR